MRKHAAEIACVARRLERALDAAHDEPPDLRAVVELAQAYSGAEPPSIEAVEELLEKTTPWLTAPYVRLQGAAFYICCALEGALVLPGMTDRIQRYLRGAIVHLDSARATTDGYARDLGGVAR